MIKKPEILSYRECQKAKLPVTPPLTDNERIAQCQRDKDYKEMLERFREFARIAENYLDTGICDICYEDNCGDEFSCTKGKYGESCECHTRINEARTKLENSIRQALQSQLEGGVRDG